MANVNQEAPSASLTTRLKARQFHVLQKLLFSWIKPTILGCDETSLGINTLDDVCYVLPYRSIADLLVIDKACEAAGLPRPSDPLGQAQQRGAFFFLGQPEGALGRKTQRQYTGRLTKLLEQQAEQSRPHQTDPCITLLGASAGPRGILV